MQEKGSVNINFALFDMARSIHDEMMDRLRPTKEEPFFYVKPVEGDPNAIVMSPQDPAFRKRAVKIEDLRESGQGHICIQVCTLPGSKEILPDWELVSSAEEAVAFVLTGVKPWEHEKEEKQASVAKPVAGFQAFFPAGVGLS